ncbi:hypothetical protein XaplCFBP3122_14670 [Xanthomonas arboricola pv. populi]|uniref:GST C-terminal domain-containing protein n=1 Tax=Xanthomonas arboricola pv. populi TaxID=487823 RepID=A0A2S6Z279_9XANT|nr:glutathione S-transferase domain-containing protein [Xanthomonas arboricola]PPT74985.1 hypothetical protein XaplCFBP3122_14670 [Xanthomonas arboricola pv. populi]
MQRTAGARHPPQCGRPRPGGNPAVRQARHRGRVPRPALRLRRRAQQRAWIEFAAPTFADAWQFLNASDQASADTASAAFRSKLQKREQALGQGPYFAGPTFGMVDVVFAPLLRYFGLLPAQVCAPIFEGLPRIGAWRAALAARPSVIGAVAQDYASRFQQHLHRQRALLADAVRVPA